MTTRTTSKRQLSARRALLNQNLTKRSTSSTESDSGSDISDDEVLGRSVAKGKAAKQSKGGKQYIVEDDAEPLDLLDRRALAQVSSTKPSRNGGVPQKKRKAATDIDGKLVFTDAPVTSGAATTDATDADGCTETGLLASGAEPGDGTLEGSLNAYLNTMRGANAVQKGQKGKLTSNQSAGGAGGGNDGEEMEIDAAEFSGARRRSRVGSKGRGGGVEKRGGNVRRGLVIEKQRGEGGGREGVRKVQGGGFARGGRGGGGRGSAAGLSRAGGRGSVRLDMCAEDGGGA
ncbi:pre-rRNA processing protein [Oleoguttula sp. CCFEE 5521]